MQASWNVGDVPGRDAFAAQCVDLSVEVLFRGPDAGVPNIHTTTVLKVVLYVPRGTSYGE
jgi:hypothetical protein